MRGFWRDAEKARPACGTKYALPVLLMRRCGRAFLTVLRAIPLIALRRTGHRISNMREQCFRIVDRKETQSAEATRVVGGV